MAPAPKVWQDVAQKTTLKHKLMAFEAASKAEPKELFKKTWRQVGSAASGRWNPKKIIPGGPAPKKSLADLP